MKLRSHQQKDLIEIFKCLAEATEPSRILYQLPTGGGKTHVFTEIARKFITEKQTRVIILTHRQELCAQTSRTLTSAQVKNTVINSHTRHIPDTSSCYIAMVETLKNRISDGLFDPAHIGLVIVDEAHHNAFRSLLDEFQDATIIGVTATPISSNRDQPLHDTYEQLILGQTIPELIAAKQLAKPRLVEYDVELGDLKTGQGGDYVISSSDGLYTTPAMLKLLLDAYYRDATGKKTIIFNHGIFASKEVCRHFEEAGLNIRHLDHNASEGERKEILKWFKRTTGAILSSVSILTTGFDEPGVQCVVLNRATTSLALYHQMVGRGSRYLSTKKTFTIIDLGNNAARFGPWHEPIDWPSIFRSPESYYAYMHALTESQATSPAGGCREHFPNSLHVHFDVRKEWHEAESKGLKPQHVIRQSINQHVKMCLENSDTLPAALVLIEVLKPEISFRVKQFCKCRGRVTRNYVKWLEDDYLRRLSLSVQNSMKKTASENIQLSA